MFFGHSARAQGVGCRSGIVLWFGSRWSFRSLGVPSFSRAHAAGEGCGDFGSVMGFWFGWSRVCLAQVALVSVFRRTFVGTAFGGGCLVLGGRHIFSPSFWSAYIVRGPGSSGFALSFPGGLWWTVGIGFLRIGHWLFNGIVPWNWAGLVL